MAVLCIGLFNPTWWRCSLFLLCSELAGKSGGQQIEHQQDGKLGQNQRWRKLQGTQGTCLSGSKASAGNALRSPSVSNRSFPVTPPVIQRASGQRSSGHLIMLCCRPPLGRYGSTYCLSGRSVYAAVMSFASREGTVSCSPFSDLPRRIPEYFSQMTSVAHMPDIQNLCL